MEYRKISDVEAPASGIGLGTWAMGGVQWGGADDDESVRTIHAALDQGMTLIDTAPAYGFGHSEEVVGRALAEHGGRGRVVLATKMGLERKGDGVVRNATRGQIFREVEDSLRRLRTDYIDLYQVHWPDAATPHEETAAALVELKRQGKILAIGVSNYSPGVHGTARGRRADARAVLRHGDRRPVGGAADGWIEERGER